MTPAELKREVLKVHRQLLADPLEVFPDYEDLVYAMGNFTNTFTVLYTGTDLEADACREMYATHPEFLEP